MPHIKVWVDQTEVYPVYDVYNHNVTGTTEIEMTKDILDD